MKKHASVCNQNKYSLYRPLFTVHKDDDWTELSSKWLLFSFNTWWTMNWGAFSWETKVSTWNKNELIRTQTTKYLKWAGPRELPIICSWLVRLFFASRITNCSGKQMAFSALTLYHVYWDSNGSQYKKIHNTWVSVWLMRSSFVSLVVHNNCTKRRDATKKSCFDLKKERLFCINKGECISWLGTVYLVAWFLEYTLLAGCIFKAFLLQSDSATPRESEEAFFVSLLWLVFYAQFRNWRVVQSNQLIITLSSPIFCPSWPSSFVLWQKLINFGSFVGQNTHV